MHRYVDSLSTHTSVCNDDCIYFSSASETPCCNYIPYQNLSDHKPHTPMLQLTLVCGYQADHEIKTSPLTNAAAKVCIMASRKPPGPTDHYGTFPPLSPDNPHPHKDDTQSIHSMNPPTGSLPRRVTLPRTVPTPRSFLRGAWDDRLWRRWLPSTELRRPLWAAR